MIPFVKIRSIQIKKYFDYNKIKTIFSDFIPNLPHRVRGFYFVTYENKLFKDFISFQR